MMKHKTVGLMLYFGCLISNIFTPWVAPINNNQTVEQSQNWYNSTKKIAFFILKHRRGDLKLSIGWMVFCYPIFKVSLVQCIEYKELKLPLYNTIYEN
jgi:hypothetical protein